MEQQYILGNLDKLSFKTSGWWNELNDIDQLTNTGVYRFQLKPGNPMQLSGSHAFAMVFNLSPYGSSYCVQIAFGIFTNHFALRNGYPKEDSIIWNPWSVIK